MPRGGPTNRIHKRAFVYAITKGFCQRRKNVYSVAVRAAEKAMQYMYDGRKLKKRDMRRLWITRINNASREHAVNYSTFINGLARENVQLNRKVLSELAMHEPRSFASLVQLARREHEEGKKGLKILL